MRLGVPVLAVLLASCAGRALPARSPATSTSGPWIVSTSTRPELCIGGTQALLLATDATLRVTGSDPVVIAGGGAASIASSQDPVTLTIEAPGPVWIEVDLSERPLRIAGDVGSLHVRAHGPERLHLGPLLLHGDIVYVTDGDTSIDGEITGVGRHGSFLGGVDPGPFPRCPLR